MWVEVFVGSRPRSEDFSSRVILAIYTLSGISCRCGEVVVVKRGKVMDHRPEKILCDCLMGPHGTVRGS